jgi:hypothetical protein
LGINSGKLHNNPGSCVQIIIKTNKQTKAECINKTGTKTQINTIEAKLNKKKIPKLIKMFRYHLPSIFISKNNNKK